MQNKIQIEVLVESSKNCSRSRIVASPYYRMKILVAAASDRANTVFIIPLQPCSHIVYSFTKLAPPYYNDFTSLSQHCNIFTTPLQACDKVTHVNLRISSVLAYTIFLINCIKCCRCCTRILLLLLSNHLHMVGRK